MSLAIPLRPFLGPNPGRRLLGPRRSLPHALVRSLRFPSPTCSRCQSRLPPVSSRAFTSSSYYREQRQQQQHRKSSFYSRLRTALRNTKTEWYPIPIGEGIAFLGFAQFYRVQQREKAAQDEEARSGGEGEGGGSGRPKKRKRIRPSGPWYARQHPS